MGNIYTKLNQLMMNDVDSAADPERPREKLETEFNTPAHHVRLPDPRSASQYIDRTPVFASLAKMGGSGDTPTTHKSAVFRARYLETDLDDVLKSNPSTNMMTSTPVPRKVIASPPVVEEIIDSIIEQAMEQISQLNFSDTGACEVVTSERSDSFLYLRRSLSEANKANIPATGNGCGDFSTNVIADGSVPSYAEEVVIHPEDVFELSDVVDENAGDSLMDNWTGIGGPERSVGTEGELSCNVPDCSTSDIFIIVDDYSHGPPSDSLIVHNHSSYETSSMMVQSDPASICTNSDSAFDLPESNVDDSILVNSPALVYRDDNDANKNVLSTPQKSLLTHKTAPRTPLGDISRNSPVIGQLQTKPAMLNDGKIWKNVQDERMKKGLISENISPLPSAFSSYPPEVVQSAPGKLRARNVKKPGTKWANDSLII